MAEPGTLDPVGPIVSVGVTVVSARLEAIEGLDHSKTDQSLKGLPLPSGGNGNSSASLSLLLMRPLPVHQLLPVHHPSVFRLLFLMYSFLSELTNMPRLGHASSWLPALLQACPSYQSLSPTSSHHNSSLIFPGKPSSWLSLQVRHHHCPYPAPFLCPSHPLQLCLLFSTLFPRARKKPPAQLTQRTQSAWHRAAGGATPTRGGVRVTSPCQLCS